MAYLFGYKYDRLIMAGFEPFEAHEFAQSYNMSQLRHTSYLVAMIKWRRLYVANLKKRGYSDDQIMIAILKLYDKKGWLAYGRPDSWKMLKSFRQKAIDEGKYIPPKRKGSHHGVGITREQVAGQRRHRRSALEIYDEGRGR